MRERRWRAHGQNCLPCIQVSTSRSACSAEMLDRVWIIELSWPLVLIVEQSKFVRNFHFCWGVFHVARFACNDIGGFAALKSEHDGLRRAGIPRENLDPGWSNALALIATWPV